MESFPTLNSDMFWSPINYVDTRQFNPTVKTPFSAGYQQRMNRVSWVPKLFKRDLRWITSAGKLTLEAFLMTVNYGQDAFYWTDVTDDTTYQVVFDESCLPLEVVPDANNNRWMVKLAFLQTTSDEFDSTEYTKTFHGGMAMIRIENLAAGSDISNRVIFGSQYGVTLSKIAIITEGAPAGVDDSNTVVITLTNGSDETIVTKTYNSANQPPSSDLGDLGALSITELDANDVIKLSVTCGATANMPAFTIVLE